MKNDLLCVHVERETLLKALSAEAILAKSGIDLLDAARLISEISEIGGTKNLKTLRRIFSLGREAFSRKRRALSFRAAAAEFLSVKSHLRKRTLSDYWQTFAAIFRADPSARDANLRSLERDADFFRALISDTFRTPRQRVKVRAVLHAFFSCAVRRGWCESNPIAGVDFPMPREQEIVPLSPEEIDALFAAAERLSLRECVPAMALMIFAGIRPREIERLSWKCIDREERVVSVMPAHSKTGGCRHVSILPRAEEILRNCGAPADESRKICPPNWQRKWKEIRAAAGWTPLGKKWRQDVLRHTFASCHLKFFKNISLLQCEMGHSSAKLLHARYLSMTGVTHASAERFWRGSATAFPHRRADEIPVVPR